MNVIQIDQKNWEKGLGKLFGKYRLFGPVRSDNYGQFKELEKGEFPDLSIVNTRLSPKGIVYPQSQVMFQYDLNGNNEGHHEMQTVDSDSTPQAVLGIRPCDAGSYLIAKNNFDNPDYRDGYWCEAYENTTFVGFACNEPEESCFCTSVGSGPYSEKGLDVLVVENDEKLFLKPITKKGEAFVQAADWSLGEEDISFEELKQKAEAKIVTQISADEIKTKSSKELFDAPFWEDLSFACINCGTCTYSCPTCWCFDIQDENQGTNGQRMRNWDSCMTPLFTLEGSGHNPRPKKHQRVRQRFMHKLKYYVEKYQEDIMCVGCGRCIKLCPVNIDIRKISQTMNSYQTAKAL